MFKSLSRNMVIWALPFWISGRNLHGEHSLGWHPWERAPLNSSQMVSGHKQLFCMPRTRRERELPSWFLRKLAPNPNMEITAKILVTCHFFLTVLSPYLCSSGGRWSSHNCHPRSPQSSVTNLLKHFTVRAVPLRLCYYYTKSQTTLTGEFSNCGALEDE